MPKKCYEIDCSLFHWNSHDKEGKSLIKLLPEIPREERYRVRRKNRRYRLRQSCGREPSRPNVIKLFTAVIYKYYN